DLIDHPLTPSREQHVFCGALRARKGALLKSPKGIGAGLGEHLTPMERPDKIPIGDRGGLRRGLLIEFGMEGGALNPPRPISIPSHGLKGKAIVNSPQPIYDQEPSTVDDDDEMSNDKEIDKIMALISLSFKKIYKPTNNNLRTLSNTSRANQDNSLRIHRNAGYESQRSGNVVGARDTVGSSMVQKYGIQCYNCKEYGHVARECHNIIPSHHRLLHLYNVLVTPNEIENLNLERSLSSYQAINFSHYFSHDKCFHVASTPRTSG
nr:hypothetical protein [Tanacetum cinerariifolium]